MLTKERQFGFTTRQLHVGYDPETTTGSRAVPIYQTSAYDLQSTDRAAQLFALQETGHIYSRISNPTSNVFENRIADLEGGIGALEVSSGQAAQMTAILDRKSTRLNSSHSQISYAVFCLKKKKKINKPMSMTENEL